MPRVDLRRSGVIRFSKYVRSVWRSVFCSGVRSMYMVASLGRMAGWDPRCGEGEVASGSSGHRSRGPNARHYTGGGGAVKRVLSREDVKPHGDWALADEWM